MDCATRGTGLAELLPYMCAATLVRLANRSVPRVMDTVAARLAATRQVAPAAALRSHPRRTPVATLSSLSRVGPQLLTRCHVSPSPSHGVRAASSGSSTQLSSDFVNSQLRHFSGRPLSPALAQSPGVAPRRRFHRSAPCRAAASGGRISQGEFTEAAWQVIIASPEVAKESRQQIVETEHLMKALLQQRNGLARRIVAKAGSDGTELLAATDRYIARQPKVSGDSSQMLGRDLEALIERARGFKASMGDEFVSIEHLLLAFCGDRRFGEKALRDAGLSQAALEKAVAEVRGSQKVTDQQPENKYEALERYGRDLTEMARQGKLDPVVGRDDEIRRAIQILSRRTKNNPVLIGEPGVGKTAISEGLAQRIVQGDVPEALINRRLISLDMGALIAGAKFRGEFEDRLKAVLKEVTDSNGGIVLFIDEIHTVVGAGASEGAMDAGNLLKPMLGRGELRCIGATTLDEYRKHIEKDPALERRFQQVYVGQPSVPDTVSILRGLRERYELHHGVRISDNALVAAATLSDRYISDRFLPDKAIDLVDEAAAKIKMEITSKPTALDEVDRAVLKLEMERLSLGNDTDRLSRERYERLENELKSLKTRQAELTEQWEREKSVMSRIQSIKEEVDRVNVEIGQAERDYDLNRAAELKYGNLISLEKQLSDAVAALNEYQQSGKSMLREEVTSSDIAEVVAKWTGIPVDKLQESEREKLLKLDDELHKRLIGQETAVTAVAEAIQRSRAGLSDPNRPIASFMFMGPTGVGKTELAKSLAAFLFDSEEALAHGDVFNVFLQILDDGRVTDSQGRTVSFRNTVIIMTSNVGSQYILQALDHQAADKDVQYQVMKERVMESARAIFRPEFMNRIDDFIVFQSLDAAQITRIVRLQLARVQQRLKDRKIRLHVTDAAVDHLGHLGYDPAYGARPVKRVIQHEVENELAKGILRGDFGRTMWWSWIRRLWWGVQLRPTPRATPLSLCDRHASDKARASERVSALAAMALAQQRRAAVLSYPPLKRRGAAGSLARVIGDDGLRADGQSLEESRAAFLKAKTVTQAAGSAYAEFGGTKVIFSV
ncbi:unnamed protein product [Closterium sp. Yama58-4]|nr:unnamed protein product [Closterium sp. Yama58-4]